LNDDLLLLVQERDQPALGPDEALDPAVGVVEKAAHGDLLDNRWLGEIDTGKVAEVQVLTIPNGQHPARATGAVVEPVRARLHPSGDGAEHERGHEPHRVPRCVRTLRNSKLTRISCTFCEKPSRSRHDARERGERLARRRLTSRRDLDHGADDPCS